MIPFRFTPEFVQPLVEVACTMPTGDPVLDKAFDEYNGNPAVVDVPHYYRLLYYLAQRTPQRLVMAEIGTHKGMGALHFLKGGPTSVAMIDITNKVDSSLLSGQNAAFFRSRGDNERAREFACKYLTGDPNGQLDIIFIDSDHSYKSTSDEFYLWEPALRSGGMMLFDDAHAECYGCSKFWRELRGDPKKWISHFLDCPQLHPEGWGFGIWFKP